jgi:RNA polymerase sigma factor (TIGR02999 family)
LEPKSRGAITRILEAAAAGDSEATERLMPLVYDELRGLARVRMRQGAPGQSLQPTELVHEAYLRLMGSDAKALANRRHFFFAAGRAMRNILVDQARRKGSRKRGGDRRKVDLDSPALAIEAPHDRMLDLDRALSKLSQESPERAEVVTLRYFAGLSLEETAEVLGVSVPTITRRWNYARAWLRRELEGAAP